MTSKRHQRRLALVAPTPSPTVQPPPAAPATPTQAYGWRPERAAEQIPTDPYENWLRYQAKSILGRDASLEEARELFSRIDIHTRQPIQAAKLPWWRRLLGA